jgi:hypothetical protein
MLVPRYPREAKRKKRKVVRKASSWRLRDVCFVRSICFLVQEEMGKQVCKPTAIHQRFRSHLCRLPLCHERDGSDLLVGWLVDRIAFHRPLSSCHVEQVTRVALFVFYSAQVSASLLCVGRLVRLFCVLVRCPVGSVCVRRGRGAGFFCHRLAAHFFVRRACEISTVFPVSGSVRVRVCV